jgi:predicted SAM-dependent methyltransferase
VVVEPVAGAAALRWTYPLLGLPLGAALTVSARWHRRLLESERAHLDRRLRRQLKGRLLALDLKTAMAAVGCPVDDDATVEQASTWKWKVVDRRHAYVIRDEGDQLLVSRERAPHLSRLIDRAHSSSRESFQGIRDQAFYASALFRKRWTDRPGRLLINVGAGKWYQPGWKVIDHSGEWYRYSNHFVDYPLDLMKKERFPFAPGSVHLFYSEHVFEHFPDDVAAFTFREMHRSLAPGRGVRIVVPDADLLHERFRVRDQRFFQPWMDKYNVSMTGAFLLLFAFIDPPPDDAEVERDFEELERAAFFDRYASGLTYDYANAGEHINWFGFDKLERMLHDAGFAVVERSAPQQSRFPEIRGKRFDTRPHYSLHVDALKPGPGVGSD